MCWLADADSLYNLALLTYDLELVSSIAQHTNKDPKEYLPYLEELKAIENDIYRHSKICLDLKNYS